jgi:hypothetical protein
MKGQGDESENRLRQMFRDAAAQIHVSRPVPSPALRSTPPRTARRSTWGLSIGLAVCLAVAAAVALDVHAFGGSGNSEPGAGNGASGALLTVDSNGAVKLLSSDTGAVLRTLVGPSPVDSSGRHLGEPAAVTVADQVAYLAYGQPSPAIESVPLAGGTLHYVTNGFAPAASPDGAKLAFFRLSAGSSSPSPSSSGSSSSESVVVRDLATGSEQTVDAIEGIGIVDALSWSPDGTQLAMTGTFMPNDTTSALSDIAIGVQILTLDQPTSGTNPHFLATPVTVSDAASGTPTWEDGQFLDSGDSVAVLASSTAGNACEGTAHTSVLLVDPTTGRTTTVATVPFVVSQAVFDTAGKLVALQRVLSPSTKFCHEATTTTTSTTAAGGTSHGSSFSSSFGFSTNGSVLENWSSGTLRKLADGVAAVSFLPEGT